MTHSRSPRFHALDTLRFIAAAFVVREHCISVVPSSASPPAWLSPWLNAYSAVAFFFVLSGFVLHLSLHRKPADFSTFIGFLIKRLFRLYPLFYLSLLLAGLALAMPGLTTNSFVLQSPYTAPTVLEQDHSSVFQWLMQLTLIAPWTDNTFVNPPMWTLAAEMRIAFLFPFLSFSARGRSPFALLLLTLVLFMTCPLLALWTIPTVAMIPLFFAGILIAEYLRSAGPMNRFWLPALLFGGLLYGTAPWLGKFNGGLTGHLYGAGLGSTLLILSLVGCPRASDLLGHSKFRFLGESSYGVYILHFPCLLWLVNIPFLPQQGGAVFFGVVLGLTILLSYLLYHGIEAPFMRMGSRLDRLLQKAPPLPSPSSPS